MEVRCEVDGGVTMEVKQMKATKWTLRLSAVAVAVGSIAVIAGIACGGDTTADPTATPRPTATPVPRQQPEAAAPAPTAAPAVKTWLTELVSIELANRTG